ncbi:MAG: ABC transporter permease [Bacteroidota bacterium]
MTKHYLLVALRTLRKERGYAALNVVGLAIGLACCVLIGLYIEDERSYDRHHERADRIARVTLQMTDTGRHWAPIGPPVGAALAEAIPEVEAVTRFYPVNASQTLIVDGDRFEASGGVYADSTLFRVFTHSLLQGDPAQALAQPQTVVLTASFARTLFGDADPMGQTLGWPGGDDLTVTGVIADLPATTHLAFDYVVSMATFYRSSGFDPDQAIGWSGFYTYLLLRPGAETEAVAAKLPGFVDAFYGALSDEPASALITLPLQLLADIHLHSALEKEYAPNGDALYVTVFLLVALFVLVLAIVNFVNLTTARSASRMREVGVRKALGSTRAQLARQFLGEAVLISLAALVLAFGLIALALPVLNGLTGKTFTLAVVVTPAVIGGLTGLGLVTGLLAGWYPAWHLSGFRPTKALWGKASGREANRLRRSLVVVQFALSIFMLVGTATVFQQLQHVRTKALGFDKERVAEVTLSGAAATVARRDLDGFMQRIEQHASIEHASMAVVAPGSRYPMDNIRRDADAPDAATGVRLAWGVDAGYAETLGLTLVAGRDFSSGSIDGTAPADTTAWLLNETAVRELGLDDPLGAVLVWDSHQYSAPIVGVVRDFHFASLHGEIEPLLIPLRPGVGSALLVRVRDDIPAALGHVRTQLDALVAGAPFTYRFLDDAFDELYRQEERLSRVFALFAGLAIAIACLGLFGLAAYTAERRRKEIGVRKVLGASVTSVVALLSGEFTRLVAVSFVTATPLAWWAMQRWLDHFAYRIDLGPGPFLVAGGLAATVALLTVSVHAVRAATADPVASLRHE